MNRLEAARWFARRMLFLVGMITAASLLSRVNASDDFQRITDRYVEYMIQTSSESEINVELANRLGDDGRWEDVEYTSDRRSDWPAVAHLTRTKQLALMARSKQASNAEKRINGSAAARAAKTWFAFRKNGTIMLPPNNYWNVLGEPSLARDCLLLLDDEIDEVTRQAMLKTIERTKMRDKGSNLMQQADVALHLGAYTRNAARVANAAQKIASLINISTDEGIKRDFSFHQHGPRLQSFHYGKSYFAIAVRLAWQLRETPWAISGRRIGFLSDFALEGLRWMSRGSATPPSTLDRAATRKGALVSADVSRELDLLAALSPRRRDLEEYSASIREHRAFPVGHRSFPESDFVAYHRPEFSFFLKTVSSQTRLTESLNGENLRGDFMNWGDHYLIQDGREYAGLQPVWNWKRLPGLTAGEDVGSRSFVDLRRISGTISTEANGVTTLEGHLSGKGRSKLVHFRKSWFCHDGQIIVLVSDLVFRGAAGGKLTTSIEQCRLRGDVTIGVGDTKTRAIKQQPRKLLEDVRWVHHNGVAYEPIGKSKLYLAAESRTGSWRRINKQYTSKPVSEPVFSLGFEHDENQPTDDFGYVILPSIAVEDADVKASKRRWKITAHDKNCHAIWFDSQNWMASFFGPGKLSVSDKVQAAVDGPCLLLFREGVLYVAKTLPQTDAISVDVTNFGPKLLRFLPGSATRRIRS